MPIVQLLRNGQLTLPVEIRRTLGLKRGDLFDVQIAEGKIVFTPIMVADGNELKKRIITLLERNWRKNEDMPVEEIERVVDKAVREVKEELKRS